MNATKEEWILTDDDSQQYVRKESKHCFSLIEMCLINPEANLFEVYDDTIDLQDYFSNIEKYKEMMEIIYTYGYASIKNMQAQYEEATNQVIAECIFEYYGSHQACQIFIGKEEKCIEFIKNYILNN